MLAGGFMNGAVEKDGRQMVIKGVVHKSSPVVSSATKEDGTPSGTITTRDKYIPTVKVIDMHTATIQVIQ